MRGADEGGHDRAVGAGAVERLADGQHVGVRRRPHDERLDGGGERLIGVVEEDVALGEHLEQVTVAGQGGRRQRHPGLRRQLGAVHRGQVAQSAEVQRDIGEEDVVLGDVDLGHEHVEKVGGDTGGHLEADGLAEAAPVQLEFDGGQQVLGVVLVHRQVGVAGHPEDVVLGDRHGREQGVEVGGDHLLDGHEPVAVGQGHEPGKQGGHLDPGDPLLVVGRIDDAQHQVEAEIRDVGERVALVDRQRRQDREDGSRVDLVEVVPVGVGQRVPVVDQDAGVAQERFDPVGEDTVLAGHQGRHAGSDGGQLLTGAETVGRAGPQAGRHLVLEPGHPHLEELVEALGEDGQELHPLEERLPLVVGQVEEPVGELGPRPPPPGRERPAHPRGGRPGAGRPGPPQVPS